MAEEAARAEAFTKPRRLICSDISPPSSSSIVFLLGQSKTEPVRSVDPSFTPKDRPAHRRCEYAAEDRRPHTPRNRIHERTKKYPLKW